jgi:hypothetical protein
LKIEKGSSTIEQSHTPYVFKLLSPGPNSILLHFEHYSSSHPTDLNCQYQLTATIELPKQAGAVELQVLLSLSTNPMDPPRPPAYELLMDSRSTKEILQKKGYKEEKEANQPGK